jgi:light-regulated signal transduction histidine kinase (bacteriophytochrome)
MAIVSRAGHGEGTIHIEAVRIRKDGTEIIVGETQSQMRDGGGRGGVAMIARDITDRVEAERALAQTRRELETRNHRLERSNLDLEQFAYVASHDLSEPLRAISGMVGLLGRRYRGQLDADADEFIDFAVNGCEQMQAMIEDILAFSRIGRTEARLDTEIDVAELFSRVTGLLAPQIEEAGATVRGSDLPVLHGDGPQITQVLQNMISNAIKFRRPDVPLTVDVSAAREGSAWLFEVADNGIGIDEKFQSRIFRMFQRLHTRDAYPGTGIGLAIAERIVDNHGGAIGVRSNASGGSTFWFTIPDSSTRGAQ